MMFEEVSTHFFLFLDGPSLMSGSTSDSRCPAFNNRPFLIFGLLSVNTRYIQLVELHFLSGQRNYLHSYLVDCFDSELCSTVGEVAGFRTQ